MLRIRTHLVLMAATILVPVVIFSGLALEMLRDGVRDTALRGLKETARATALMVEQALNGSVSSLELLAASPHLEKGQLQAFFEDASLVNNSQQSWIILFDIKGQQLVNTKVPFGEPLPLTDFFNDIQKVLQTRKPVISDLLTSPLNQQLMAMVYVPVKVNGYQRYVLGQAFGADLIARKAFDHPAEPGWVVAVLDKTGRFIARNIDSRAWVGKGARPELVAAGREQGEGMLRHFTHEQVESYDAFTTSAMSGWQIAVAAPVEQIETSAVKAALVAGIGFMLAFAGALLTAASLGQRLMQAIGQSVMSATALGQGRMPEPSPSPILELDHLQSVLAEAGHLLEHEKNSRLQAETKLESMLRSEYAARLRAEADNLAKDQFLAMLGHELRNPLAAISGAIAVIGQQDDQATSQARQIIQRQSQHLSHIVDDLLDVSRLAGGKISLSTEPVDLGALALACVEALRAAGRTAGHHLQVITEPAWVEGDPTRLEQTISNLLVNALKFTPAGGQIEMRVKRLPETSVLSVRDSGVGIGAELMPRIFDAFTQGPASLDRTQGGLGIGLALVRELIRLHGGQVTAESAGPGQGSCFTLSLPGIQAPHDLPVRLPVEPLAQAGPADALSDRVVDNAAHAAGPWRLLLIEDIDDVRRMLAQLLVMEGHTVMETGSAREGLKLAEQMQPDIAIIDIGLPEMNGYEVARALRGNPATKNLGLMAMTGYGQQEDRQNALAAGFDFHLVKPVDVDHLLEVIQACGQLARARADHARTPTIQG